MAFDVFQSKINALIERAGGGISVRYHNDTEKGKYFATCSDGTTIIGNPTSLKITVRYGSGHQHMAQI